jgi:maltose alpha-D-glucosyltransferase / alpha-amylase
MLKEEKLDAVRTRTHGDYHLGQVLYTGKDFFIIDFEGEPARSMNDRRIKQSPLRDVAGMIRSFQYASRVGPSSRTSLDGENIQTIHNWSNLWYRACVVEFLNGYLELTAGTAIIPKDENGLAILLGAFLIEKVVYELGYELNNRPDWVLIPIEGLMDLLEGGPL